jgi:hypothetical protein
MLNLLAEASESRLEVKVCTDVVPLGKSVLIYANVTAHPVTPLRLLNYDPCRLRSAFRAECCSSIEDLKESSVLRPK